MNKTPPEEYELELVGSGVTARPAKYYKTAFGQVFIHIDLIKPTGYFADGELIAVLPEGFLPRYSVVFPSAHFHNGGYISGVVQIDSIGQITVHGIGDTVNRIRAHAFYLAAQ